MQKGLSQDQVHEMQQTDSQFLHQLINLEDDDLRETSRGYELLGQLNGEASLSGSLEAQIKEVAIGDQHGAAIFLNYNKVDKGTQNRKGPTNNGQFGNKHLYDKQAKANEARIFSEYVQSMEAKKGGRTQQAQGALAQVITDKREYSKRMV